MKNLTLTRGAHARNSTPHRGITSVEPVFGADAAEHRHTGHLPPSGLTLLLQRTVGAAGEFNEREMAVIRGASGTGTRRTRGITEPKFEIVRALYTQK